MNDARDTLALAGRHTLELADGRALWRIESGRVDVFVVDPVGVDLPKPRHHLCRLEAGEGLIGVGEVGSDLPVRLIAVGGPETRLTKLPADAPAEETGPLVDAWVSRLTGRLDLETDTIDAPQTVDAHSERGRAFLDDFHRVVLAHASEEKRRAEAAASERVLLRAQFDREHTAGALGRLVAAMDGSLAEHLGADATPHTSEPLLAVMRVVGNQLGASVRAPPPVIDGIPDVYTIDDIARASRLGHRRVQLADKWWRRDVGPLIGMLERDDREPEPVALVRTGGRYVLHTADGHTVHLSPALASKLQRGAWSLYRLLPDRSLGWRDLVRFAVHGSGADSTRLAVVGLAGAALGLLSPAATQILFDEIIPGAMRTELLLLVAVLAVAGVATLVFQFVRDLAVMRLRTRADAALETAVWARLLSLPANFFRDYDAGDLADRVMGLSAAQRSLAGSTLSTLLSSGLSVVSLVWMFAYAPKLAWASTAVTAVACVAFGFAGRRRAALEREIAELRGRTQGFVLQAITAIAKLRVARGERRAFARWAQVFSRQRALQVRARRISNVLVSARQTLPLLATVGLFALVADPDAHSLSTGAFVGFLVAFGQFMVGSLQAASTLVELTAVGPYFERARPLLEAVPETNERKPQLGDIHGRIELSHVRFRYREDMPLILDDVSMAIEAGEFVAVVGKSGSGKSTLFRLLLGFEQPDGGAIYLDGHDLGGIDVQAVRSQVGAVLQTSRVMAGSILENIVASSGRSLAEAWDAAKMAGIAKDLERMPMGMHTVVTAGGGTLSGGQRQRLLIARALVKRPRIVLFDEATSALDNQTQAIVSRSLESLRLTRVVIAHRLSTVRHADRIFVLDKGRIVQSGTFEQLIDQPGPFADLAARQMT